MRSDESEINAVSPTAASYALQVEPTLQPVLLPAPVPERKPERNGFAENYPTTAPRYVATRQNLRSRVFKPY